MFLKKYRYTLKDTFWWTHFQRNLFTHTFSNAHLERHILKATFSTTNFKYVRVVHFLRFWKTGLLEDSIEQKNFDLDYRRYKNKNQTVCSFFFTLLVQISFPHFSNLICFNPWYKLMATKIILGAANILKMKLDTTNN